MKKVFFAIISFVISIAALNAQVVDTLIIGRADGSDFKTIQSAVDFFNINGINNNSVLLVTADYNPEDVSNPEVFPIKIKNIPNSSADKSLVLSIQNDVLLSDSTDCIFRFEQNSGNFTLQGNNRLSLVNNSCGNGSSVVEIACNTVGNIIIDGCSMMAGSNLDSTYCVYVNSSLTIDNNSSTSIYISNNEMSRAMMAVCLNRNSAATTFTDEIIVSGNVIGDVRNDFMITHAGLDCNFVGKQGDKLTINDNRIFSITSKYDNVSGVSVNASVDAEIFDNLILDVVNYHADSVNISSKAVGISVITTDTLVCYNNMISHVAGQNAFGIELTTSDASIAEFYYNSVYLCEDNSSLIFGDGLTSCYKSNTSEKGGIFLRNNIFQNNFGDIYGEPPATASCLIIGSNGSIEDCVNNSFTSSNNIYYVKEMENGYEVMSREILNSSVVDAFYDLNGWNTLNNDTTCVAVNPNFTSTSLLEIASSNAVGIPIDGITVDYFGNERNLYCPDAGACEIEHGTGIRDWQNNIVFKSYYDGENVVINSESELNGEIYLFDMSGRVVAFSKINGTDLKMNFNGKKGIYIVSYFGDSRASKKILIQ